VHRVAWHRRDQHPQRHLIRPHHHTLNHGSPTMSADPTNITTLRRTHRETADQHHDHTRLRGIASTSPIPTATIAPAGRQH
ncbi:MAG: hypothetical protein LC776_18800, partial [Acidobacteria bacterium]|nr:hypothetical protein [Acidobacteriota bacterium]